MLAVSVLLPRPLAVAGGICITGIQMLKEVIISLIFVNSYIVVGGWGDY